MQVRGVTDVSMGIGSGFRELGRFLDDCERRGGPVEHVDVAEVTDAGGEGLRAELELTLSVDLATGVALCDPQVCPDGTVRFALESTTELIPTADHDVSVEPTGTALDGDDTVTVRFAATVPDTSGPTGDDSRAMDAIGTDRSDTGGVSDGVADRECSDTARVDGETVEESRGAAGGSPDPVDDGSATSEREVPPFKDPDLLAEVYDSCETFAEMADVLEMDVTAETVRRYMIDYDIHEPNTYQTGEDPTAATGDEGQVVLSDGIGLPDEVTAEDLIETVERSNTIYEVKQDIDIDRDDALEMLQDLNLLDLVVGRLATEGERDITREDIVDRLREASAVQ